MRTALILTTILLPLLPVHSADLDTGDCKGTAGQCSMAEHEAQTPVLKGELAQLIHEALLEHPEWVDEAHAAYMKQMADVRAATQKRNMAAARDALLRDPRDGVIGDPRGDVTLVEFFDNQCPFCHLLEPTIEALVKSDPHVRIVLKEFVLWRNGSAMLGPGSLDAAKAAIAARQQGAALYAAFHHALMSDPTKEGELALPHIMELAAGAGLDTKRLQADMQAPEVMKQIEDTQALAQKIGATGTPSLILDGQILQSRDLTSLQNAVKTSRHAGGV